VAHGHTHIRTAFPEEVVTFSNSPPRASSLLCVDQGPNYALAKRLQHWLAVIARASGHTVSSNIAPSTATVSVVHNAQFAAAYKGFHLFKPMEVFYQVRAGVRQSVSPSTLLPPPPPPRRIPWFDRFLVKGLPPPHPLPVHACSPVAAASNGLSLWGVGWLCCVRQDTSNAVMGALLLNDIANPASTAHVRPCAMDVGPPWFLCTPRVCACACVCLCVCVCARLYPVVSLTLRRSELWAYVFPLCTQFLLLAPLACSCLPCERARGVTRAGVLVPWDLLPAACACALHPVHPPPAPRFQANVRLPNEDNNPIYLFSPGAFHGGIWRNAFTIDSIGAVAAGSTYLKQYALHLVAASAGLAAYVSWLVKNE
jgi:hypothetical protein